MERCHYGHDVAETSCLQKASAEEAKQKWLRDKGEPFSAAGLGSWVWLSRRSWPPRAV